MQVAFVELYLVCGDRQCSEDLHTCSKCFLFSVLVTISKLLNWEPRTTKGTKLSGSAFAGKQSIFVRLIVIILFMTCFARFTCAHWLRLHVSPALDSSQCKCLVSSHPTRGACVNTAHDSSVFSSLVSAQYRGHTHSSQNQMSLFYLPLNIPL